MDQTERTGKNMTISERVGSIDRVNDKLEKALLKEETVDHPSHYGGDTVYEAIKVIEAWDLGFCLGNVVKYISRAGKKTKLSYIEDLKKARWYLDREISRLER